VCVCVCVCVCACVRVCIGFIFWWCWLKNSIIWNKRPCSPIKVNRRYVATCRIHLQGWRLSQTRKQGHQVGPRLNSMMLEEQWIRKYALLPFKTLFSRMYRRSNNCSFLFLSVEPAVGCRAPSVAQFSVHLFSLMARLRPVTIILCCYSNIATSLAAQSLQLAVLRRSVSTQVFLAAL
jgi:hypothetical protein